MFFPIKISKLSKHSWLNKSAFEKVLEEAFDLAPAELFLNRDKIQLPIEKRIKLKRIEKKLCRGIPWPYALGLANFYGRKFLVNKNVLVPRFETEMLVHEAENYILKKISDNYKTLDIIDLGTGSGAIITTLFRNLKEILKKNPKIPINFWAVDISKKALSVAQKNARNLKAGKIQFLKSNLFSNKALPEKFDLILANLPYLKPDYKITNPALKFEPEIALNGGKNGLEIIKKVIKILPGKLKNHALAILEIDPRQKDKIKKAGAANFKISFRQDLNRRTRFVLLKKNSGVPN